MKSQNKRYIVLIVSLGIIFSLTIFYKMEVMVENTLSDDKLSYSNNLLDDLKDGMQNEEIVKFYKEDIEEVELLSSAPISIKYNNVDINDDGLRDYFVIICSVMHSGSRGDYVGLLLKQQNNTFSKVDFPALYTSGAAFKIQNLTTDGLHDIYYDSGISPDEKPESMEDTKYVLKFNSETQTYDLCALIENG